MIKYYCKQHAQNHSKPLSEDKGLCNAVGGCKNTARFEVNEPETDRTEPSGYGYITCGRYIPLTREEYLELKRSLQMED